MVHPSMNNIWFKLLISLINLNKTKGSFIIELKHSILKLIFSLTKRYDNSFLSLSEITNG